MHLAISHDDTAAGTYVVEFDGGEAVLDKGERPGVLDIVWLGVHPEAQGQGVGEKALAALNAHFSCALSPWGVVAEAKGFWERMAAKGLCVAAPTSH